jgi:hypothetical protein
LYTVTSKQFLAAFCIGLAAFPAVVIPLSLYTDIYGLFRPGGGRRLPIYGEERTAKYLYSFRYIPENFQGVLLGSSVSDNLDLRSLPGWRIYNASINGGNVADLAPIAENIYRRRDMELTMVCIHRYLTLDHDRKTRLMTPRQYWTALGSPQLIAAHLSRAAVRAGFTREEYDDRGTLQILEEPTAAQVEHTIDKTLVEIRRGTASVGNYRIDPIAFAELRNVVNTARIHSRRMLVFYPPVPAAVLALRSAEYAAYRDQVAALLEPTDLMVDFNLPKYAALRSDTRNFVDAAHMSGEGARRVVAELGRALEPSGGESPSMSAQVKEH